MNNPHDMTVDEYNQMLADEEQSVNPHWTTYLRGKRHEPGKMNKLEAAYALHLAALNSAGVVLWWAFEPMKLVLAKSTSYTVDFLVHSSDLVLECHEVKGAPWTPAARVKIKVAARLYPFRFMGVTHKGTDPLSGWKYENFSG